MASPTLHAQGVTLEETTDTLAIHHLAHQTWQPTYKDILAPDQIQYMLDMFYTPASLQQQMEEGQTFLLVKNQGEPAAFASYSLLYPEEKVYKLNKLYIHPGQQGKGFGKLLLQEIVRRIQPLGATALDLNVHRQNPALQFYLKHGFHIHQTLDIPLGPYTLNDHILRLPLTV
ncbi:GNAT family N-acetyltransferase [Nibribacter ruber]|uniref:GNAT family N-acetyltransferase n=1 Tax=Nibribacter ruber TaxID=2698458 RepID=A0A6P1P103_9BACT|nr:GNAT family N-acetyltransferase [Nibribacter ruber]QHL87143.1 GNAT family N-acetyltransferase [Nibribacter ruber]